MVKPLFNKIAVRTQLFSCDNCEIFKNSFFDRKIPVAVSIYRMSNHSHKKWKDSLKGRLDRVLLAAELEFPKILVTRLPQNT